MSWNETIDPLGPAISQSASAVLSSNLQISKAYPAVQLLPTEANSLELDITEVGGDTFWTQNLTYNASASQWQLVKSSIVGYGMVLRATGHFQLFTVPANSPPGTAFTILFEIDNTGAIITTPNITTAGALTAGSITTSGALSAGSISTAGTLTAGAIDISGFTTGSVLFSGASGQVTQNNSLLFWDNTNGRFGIGTNTPATALDVVGYQTVAASIQRLLATWNAPGVNMPGAFLVNVTDTASGSSSLLVDLQVGSTSKFNVDKSGNVTTKGNINLSGSLSNSGVFYFDAGNAGRANTSGLNRFRMLQSMASVYLAGTQSIGNNLFTTINWDTALVNTDNMWSSSAPSRLTAPITGKYLITATVNAWTGISGLWECRLTRNGGEIVRGTTDSAPGGAYAPISVAQIIYPLNAGDYVECQIYQNSGASFTLGAAGSANNFGMLYIGE